jgi:hypothetical protein
LAHIVQLAFLAGTALIIGIRKTSRFFFQWHKLRGTLFFFAGILLIIVFGYTFVGLVVEAVGFVSLFGYVRLAWKSMMEACRAVSSHSNSHRGFVTCSDIIPVALVVARQLPIIGPILSHPVLARVRASVVDYFEMLLDVSADERCLTHDFSYWIDQTLHLFLYKAIESGSLEETGYK